MTSRTFPSIVCSLRILLGALLAATALTPPLFAQADAWAKRELGDVTFEAPFELKDFGDVAANLPAEVKEKVESMHSSMGGSEGSFVVFVTSSTYKAGVALNLDGAVKGMVNGAAGKMGDPNPQYTANAIKVSGLDARKGSYQKSLPDGRVVRIEFLAIDRGQTLWQVQALTMNDKTAPDMARLLASVAIKPAP